MLSITGLVMLFDDEIELAFHQDAIEIVASGEPIKVSQQLAAVQHQYPQGTVTQFVPSKVPDLANRFSVSRRWHFRFRHGESIHWRSGRRNTAQR